MPKTDTITFEGMVSGISGKPFVKLTVRKGARLVYEVKFDPATVTALGLRAVQAAIEAERDAGFVAFLAAESPVGLGLSTEASRHMLRGLRDHREQFDSDIGAVSARISENDRTKVSDGL